MSTQSTTSGKREAALQLRGIERRYGAVRALRDASFSIPRGSLCGLVGPNGAGKTTTIRIIATDLEPSGGDIQVLGMDPRVDARAVRGRIGYMPDSAGLYEELDLREYLEFFAALHGLPAARRRQAVDVAMELSGTTKFARRRLVGLSKGERQRVLLARTLIHDPEILILDEPGDGLDPEGRIELRELLLLLHQRGKTILVSSHVLADLELLCTHLVLVRDGRVVYSGTRERLLARGGALATLRIECLGDGVALSERLAVLPDVVVLAADAVSIQAELPGDPATSAALLRRLVEEGFGISSFARQAASLEDAYLRIASDGDEEESGDEA